MADVVPWWEMPFYSNQAPDLPPQSSPPPSTVNMWTGEAPGSSWTRPSPTPYSAPVSSPNQFFNPTPNDYAGYPSPIGTGAPPPASISDIPGGEIPLQDYGTGPIVETPTAPPDIPTEPGEGPPVASAQPFPITWDPRGLYYGGTPTASGWGAPTNYRNITDALGKIGSGIRNFAGDIFGGIRNAFEGPGYYDPSYLTSIGYTPGQGVGSLWPGEGFSGARGGPLPGSGGLGASGGSLGGSYGNSIAANILAKLEKFGTGTSTVPNAFGDILMAYNPGATGPGYAYGQSVLTGIPGGPGGPPRGRAGGPPTSPV